MTAEPISDVGLILLAAGGSVRMGQPKQLLRFRGQSLLRHACVTALASPCHPVIVVLGANAALLRPELSDLNVQIIENSEWQTGMNGSLRAGLNALLAHRQVSAALVMLCDQPFVTPELLTTLIEKWQQTGKSIAACAYGDSVGVPALFDNSLFAELLTLQGAAGAKKIFAKYPDAIAAIPFEQGEWDVDTPEDYARVTGE